MTDPVTAALLAAKGVETVGNLFSRRDAQNLSVQQLNAQIANAEKAIELQLALNAQQQKLALAPRTDAAGNVTRFDPDLGFVSTLSPAQQQIFDAQNRENLRALVEDTARNRRARERQELRSTTANRGLIEALNRLRFQSQPNEAVETQRATQALTTARQRGVDQITGALTRNAIRQGNSSAVPELLKAGGRAVAEDFQSDILRGRQEGRSAVAQQLQNRGASFLPIIRTFAGVLGNSAATIPKVSSQVAGQGQAIQNLINTLSRGAANIGSAQRGLTNAISRRVSPIKPLDFNIGDFLKILDRNTIEAEQLEEEF